MTFKHIAAALAKDPLFSLGDEPTSAAPQRVSRVPRISRNYIEKKAEIILKWVRPSLLDEPSLTPVTEIVERLSKEHGVKVSLNKPLGLSPRGRRILGACVFRPLSILIDPSVGPTHPRFRFTLAHELGHLVLHRKLTLRVDEIDQPIDEISDSWPHFHFGRKERRTDRDWLEWHANTFASALLMPRATVRGALIEKQLELGIRRLGTIHLDRQWENVRHYKTVLLHLQQLYQVSRTMAVIRLRELEMLTEDIDSRGVNSLFSEEATP